VRVTHHQAHNKLIKHINSDIISEDVEEELQSVLDLRNLEKVPVCSCHGLFVICYCDALCMRLRSPVHWLLKRRCHQRPAAAGEHHAKLSRC
jgi:hypothetical protein